MHPSARPAGRGRTIGTPRLYDWSSRLLPGRRRVYRTLIAVGGVRDGDRVLDVGCGPGYFARMVAEVVGQGGLVVGLDAAPEMTEYAAKKASRLSNCRFQAGTAESLPFADASFDVVTSSLMLHHLPDETRLRAVHEMARVLRPGGRLVLADFHLPERGPWRLLRRLHHAGAVEAHVSPLEPLVREAGFIDLQPGDAPPLLHYVRATRGRLGQMVAS